MSKSRRTAIKRLETVLWSLINPKLQIISSTISSVWHCFLISGISVTLSPSYCKKRAKQNKNPRIFSKLG